ncbi:hypothetical protein [Bacillus sp. Marseille-Q3570]|uniref:hypothetical protein n=1 Tax=Bacillus sp. Marseille-Q3570 TaxID=2963522 RepID=UPI0021B7ADCF|nr:hypothetical protein [Bacillus sp. Marseille-Q3570]
MTKWFQNVICLASTGVFALCVLVVGGQAYDDGEKGNVENPSIAESDPVWPDGPGPEGDDPIWPDSPVLVDADPVWPDSPEMPL